MPVENTSMRHSGRVLLILIMLAAAGSAKDAPAFRSAPSQRNASMPASRSDPVYPGDRWTAVASPTRDRWSGPGLRGAHAYADSIGSSAVLIVESGAIVEEWGDVTRRIHVRSMRKSLLSALFGIYVGNRTIDIQATLGQLGIDDWPPALNEQEKRARIVDLLRLRSGVYHVANDESDYMRRERPARGRYPPGEHWYYNNWDVHALTAILEKQAGMPLPQMLDERIARPLQMQDFRVADVHVEPGSASVYPSWWMRMSARDLARFGLLYLRAGRWKDRRIVPEEWVHESTRYMAEELGPYSGWAYGAMGYLWWVTVNGKHLAGVDVGSGAFSARGAGGQHLVIVPAYDLVIAHMVDDAGGREVTDGEIGKLLDLILAARR